MRREKHTVARQCATGEERPGGLEDVYPFYVVLKPQGRELWRLLVVGRKRLPDPERHEFHWGYVDKIADRAEAIESELRGAMPGEGGRKVEAARPVGEGVYAIVRHHGDMHLAYALELPKRPGLSQRALGIAEEGVMALTVKNLAAGGSEETTPASSTMRAPSSS